MKEYREEYAGTQEYKNSYRQGFPLVTHIAWLTQQLEHVPKNSREGAIVRFDSYEEVNEVFVTTVEVLYSRIETDAEERAREEAEARRRAERTKREQEASDNRRKLVMAQLGKMSPEEKQAILTHLQQPSETNEKAS